MGRPRLSGGPEYDVISHVTLVAAAAATPPIEIGAIVLITTGADANRVYRRTASSNPGIAGDFEIIDSVTAADLTNVAAGGIAATNVQAAINELDTEKINVAGIQISASTLAAVPVLAANTIDTQALVCVPPLPATAIVLGIELSAGLIANAVISRYMENDGAGNANVTIGNVSGVAVAVAADAAVQVQWYDPAAA